MMKPIDFFAVMGLPRRLDLDPQVLESIYYRLSRETHPDFHFDKPVAERAEWLDRSAVVNKAYRTLREFHSRVAYLIELEGAGELKPQAPPELLEEVIEVQDALERARELNGDATPETRRVLAARLREEAVRFQERLTDLESTLHRRAGEWNAALVSSNGARSPVQQQLLRTLQDLLSQRVYLMNLLRDLEPVQPSVAS
jgi:molecular chaperone HscB